MMHMYCQYILHDVESSSPLRSAVGYRGATGIYALVMYPPQVRHEGALLRVSPLSAPAESLEDASRSRRFERVGEKYSKI